MKVPTISQQKEDQDGAASPTGLGEHLVKSRLLLLVDFDLSHDLREFGLSICLGCISRIVVQSLEDHPCLLTLSFPHQETGGLYISSQCPAQLVMCAHEIPGMNNTPTNRAKGPTQPRASGSRQLRVALDAW